MFAFSCAVSPPLFSLCLLFQHGYTALMRASWNGHATVVKNLLDGGADRNLQTNVSTPPSLSKEITKDPSPQCLYTHSHP